MSRVSATSSRVSSQRSVTYPSKERPGEILSLLHQQRETGLFCDVQLKLGPSKVVHAHKAVLASCSFYFTSMFTSQFMEASSDVVDISHASNSDEVLNEVINSFYGQPFEICETNVGETLNLASMFLLDDLKHICEDVLSEMVNVGNSAEIFLLSMNYDLKFLQSAVFQIFGTHFHDSVMFQEEVLEFNSIQLQHCITYSNTEDIARKSDYLGLLLKWFAFNECDDRAECLLLLLNDLPFKVTISVYRDNEKEISDILEHLVSANSEISIDKAEKLKAQLESLKPDSFDTIVLENQFELDFNEPVKQSTTFGFKLKVIGCRTEEEGYSSEEEKEYKRHQAKVAHIEHHRELAKLWPPSEECSEPAPSHPDRPKHIERELPWPVHLSRSFRQKTERELLEVSRLVDMVVVVAPGVDYFEKRDQAAAAGEAWSLDICGYVPGMRAWYKLGSFDVDVIQKTGGSYRNTTSGQFLADYSQHSRGSFERWRNFPPQLLEGLDDEDAITMRTGGRLRSHNRQSPSQHITELPPFSDSKWGVAYLRHKVYFYHQDYCESVFVYDLLDEAWIQTKFDAVESWNGAPITVEGTELIVLGQILFAVVRIVIYDLRGREYRSKADHTPKREACVIHKIYRFNEERKSWQHFISTNEHYVSLYLDRPSNSEAESPRGYGKFYKYNDIPMMRQPGTFRTVLFAEDEEKLNIVLLVKKGDYEKSKDYSLSNLFMKSKGYSLSDLFMKSKDYSVSDLSMVYLDLRQVQHVLEMPTHQRYIRQPTPLHDDEMFVFINDNLHPTLYFDMRDPGTSDRLYEYRNKRVEAEGCFLNATQSHPLQPAMLTSDGNRMWILKSNSDCTSSLTEYTISVCRETKRNRLNKHSHPPPPFKGFAMACTGKLDMSLIHVIQPPTKYLHP